jgi:ubiquinone/menaquinone biosynthesis C-methylase UbiE
MDQDKVRKIKQAIRANFESSPARYRAFEDRWGFFGKLNSALLNRMNLPAAAKVLDVGCGTGASCERILTALPESRVWGLDMSPAMLEAARDRTAGIDRLTLIEGDAAKLTEYFHFSFDGILYSASIFLIPDYKESLRQTRELLKENGSAGLTFMEGLYDLEGNNLLAMADLSAGEGVNLRKPVKLEECRDFFTVLFPVHTVWVEDFELPEDLLREFFSVPAMSAGLFPGVEYSQRVAKVGRLFDRLPKTPALFRWLFMVGEKKV